MNYYTPITDEHQHAFNTCFAAAVKIAAENNFCQILLVVPTRGALQSGVIEELIGESAVNALLSKKKVVISPITLFLQTKKAKASGFFSGPVLAAYAYFEQIKPLLENKKIPGIILYSNAPEDIEAFKKAAPAKELNIIS